MHKNIKNESINAISLLLSVKNVPKGYIQVYTHSHIHMYMTQKDEVYIFLSIIKAVQTLIIFNFLPFLIKKKKLTFLCYHKSIIHYAKYVIIKMTDNIFLKPFP